VIANAARTALQSLLVGEPSGCSVGWMSRFEANEGRFRANTGQFTLVAGEFEGVSSPSSVG